MSSETSKPKADLEWEQRTLCSDEACIGTIGPDGTCRECGKPYEGELPRDFDQIPDDGAAEMPSDEDESSITEAADGDEIDDGQEQGEWEQRTLCSDGNCIGVIGADGRCKECGKPADG